MDVETTSSTTTAFLADQGASAVFGMIGAAVLYLIMPPIDRKGKFHRKHFYQSEQRGI